MPQELDQKIDLAEGEIATEPDKKRSVQALRTGIATVLNGKFPIALKVALVQSALMVGAGQLYETAAINEERIALREQIELRGQSMVRSLANAAAPGLLERKDLNVEAAIAKVSKESVVDYAAVADKNNKILSHTDMDLRGKSLKSASLKKTDNEVLMEETVLHGKPIFNFATPVLFAERRLGTAYLGLSQDTLISALDEAKKRLQWITMLITVLGSLGMAGAMTYILRPIRTLEAGVKKLADDLTHRINIDSNDEFGVLSTAINNMAGQLDEHEKERLREGLREGLRKQEMNMATEMQLQLLPSSDFNLHGISISAMYKAAMEVGGDFYDYFPLKGDRIGVLIADVKGKGVSAAFVMAMSRIVFRMVSNVEQGARNTLIRANEVLTANLPPNNHLTVSYAVIDPKKGNITYSSAGHPSFILIRKNGETELHKTEGFAVGVRRSAKGIEGFNKRLTEQSVPFRQGDTLLFSTDGIEEQPNEKDEAFGKDRITEILMGHRDRPIGEVPPAIMQALEAFQGEAGQFDDRTFVAVRNEDRIDKN